MKKITKYSSKPSSKYRAIQCQFDGKSFSSKAEMKRYADLRLQEKAGRISDLQTQVKYKLCVNGLLVCSYIADFVYKIGDKEIVEDKKSAITKKNPVYRIKNKLMRAIYGIEILET